eukprot:1436029-Amphidinium_carterae.1
MAVKPRHLWSALEAAGAERLEVEKVKAQLPKLLAGAPPEEHFKWLGNDAADKRARGVFDEAGVPGDAPALKSVMHD